MYHRVLVPLDGMPEAEVAVAPAGTLAVALGAELLLVRVIPTGGPMLKALDSDEVSQAQAYLTGVASTLQPIPHQPQVAVVVSEGSPADTIVGEAQTRDVDLIVMATHARGGAVRVLLGSVADQVVRTARQPVLLVKRLQPRAALMHRSRASEPIL